MTLTEIMQDIHACEEDMLVYESKYGILTSTFYAAYRVGEEPPSISWLGDWHDWAGAYEIWLKRRQQYIEAIQLLRRQTLLS